MMKEKRNVFNAQMKLKINEQSIKFHYELQPTNGKKNITLLSIYTFHSVLRETRLESGKQHSFPAVILRHAGFESDPRHESCAEIIIKTLHDYDDKWVIA